MGDVVKIIQHRFHSCQDVRCCICGGGLQYCTVCNGAEASLPKDCPRTPMTPDQADTVASGIVDYHGDKGWVWVQGIEGFSAA